MSNISLNRWPDDAWFKARQAAIKLHRASLLPLVGVVNGVRHRLGIGTLLTLKQSTAFVRIEGKKRLVELLDLMQAAP